MTWTGWARGPAMLSAGDAARLVLRATAIALVLTAAITLALTDGVGVVVLAVAVPVVVVVAGLVGLPVGVVLARVLRGRRAWWHVVAYLLAGAAAGILGGLPFLSWGIGDSLLVLGAVVGAVAAGVGCAWTIERTRHPWSRVPNHVPDELVEDYADDLRRGDALP